MCILCSKLLVKEKWQEKFSVIVAANTTAIAAAASASAGADVGVVLLLILFLLFSFSWNMYRFAKYSVA